MTTKITESWYNSLIEELADIITETGFTSRWALVEGYHTVGVRILQENDNFERAKIYKEKILQRIAESLGKSERTLYYAVQFAKMYPDLSLLPEGKNLSWSHIVNKYLTTGEKKVTITKGDLMKQIEAIKKLLETRYLEYHQQEEEMVPGYCDLNYDRVKACIEEIRYLQDQVNKIVEGCTRK